MPKIPFALAALTLAFSTVGARAQTAIPPAPKDFVATMSQSDQYEITAANVALIEASNPQVRSFAQMMIQDHTKTSADLLQAARAAGLPAPDPGMSSDQAALLGGLQGVRGADFDKAYARQQVIAHTAAVAVDESFSTAGAEPNLQTAAKSVLPMLRDHLKMAQQLLVDVGG